MVSGIDGKRMERVKWKRVFKWNSIVKCYTKFCCRYQKFLVLNFMETMNETDIDRM